MAKNAEQYEQLTAYLDGELSETQRAKVEHVLATDEEARRLLEDLRRTSKLVASLPRGRAPSNLAQAVTARLEREALLGESPGPSATGTERRALWRALGVAAAMALVVTAGWLMFPTLRGTDQATQPIMLADNDAPGRTRGETVEGALSSRLDVAARADNEEEAPSDSYGLVRTEFAAEVDARKATVTRQRLADSDDDAAVAPGKRSATLKETLRSVDDDGISLAIGAEQGMAAPKVARGLDKPTETSAPVVAAPAAARSGRMAKRGGSGPPHVLRLGETKGDFDRLLSESALTHQDIRQASAASFSNRVALETDPQTRARLLTRIGAFMSSHLVPSLDARDPAEPVEASEPFYLVQAGSSSVASPPGASRRGDEIRVVMHVSRAQAETLFFSMDEVARRHDAPIAWTANDVHVAPTNAAIEVVRQLGMMEHVEKKGVLGPAAAALEADTEEEHSRTGRTLHTRRRARRAAGRAAKSRKTPDRDKKAPVDRRKDRMVAIALSLRATPATTQPARRTESKADVKATAASQRATSRPVGRPQPTTQGASGG